MSNAKAGYFGAWISVIAGLGLTALPLYSRLFTMELESSASTETEFSISTRARYKMMHVPEWMPFAGGLLTLVGGVFIGCRQKSNADESDAGQ